MKTFIIACAAAIIIAIIGGVVLNGIDFSSSDSAVFVESFFVNYFFFHI